jgi:hypothetical protein
MHLLAQVVAKSSNPMVEKSLNPRTSIDKPFRVSRLPVEALYADRHKIAATDQCIQPGAFEGGR